MGLKPEENVFMRGAAGSWETEGEANSYLLRDPINGGFQSRSHQTCLRPLPVLMEPGVLITAPPGSQQGLEDKAPRGSFEMEGGGGGEVADLAVRDQLVSALRWARRNLPDGVCYCEIVLFILKFHR